MASRARQAALAVSHAAPHYAFHMKVKISEILWGSEFDASIMRMFFFTKVKRKFTTWEDFPDDP